MTRSRRTSGQHEPHIALSSDAPVGVGPLVESHTWKHANGEYGTSPELDLTPSDTAADPLSDGFEMDSGTGDDEKFCGGNEMMGSTVMYMEGFRLTLASHSNTPCLNFLFPQWTLDSSNKFVAAMAATVALSVLVEGVSAFRLRARRVMRPSLAKRAIMFFFHGFQAFLGYVVMMLTMTFSIELLLAVALGLGLGYTVFFGSEDTTAHVTTNPCCAFMTDEAQENRSRIASADPATAGADGASAEIGPEDSLLGTTA